MVSVTEEQALAARNRIVDAWMEDVLAAHKAPASQCSQDQKPQLPKFHPSPVNSSGKTPSSLSYAPRPTNRRGKRKRGLHPLQDADPNMNPTPSQPPPPLTPKPGAAKKSTRSPRKGKSDKTKAQGEQTPKHFTRSSLALAQATASPLAYSSAMAAYAKAEENVTQSASSPLAQAGKSRSIQRLQLGSSLNDQTRFPPPLNFANAALAEENVEDQGEKAPAPRRGRVTQQHESDSPLDDQVPLAPSGYTAAVGHNAALASRAKSQPKSAGGASRRSKSPLKSTADLSLAEKPIRLTDFEITTQLPLDVSEMYEKLLALSSGNEILPAVIKVSTLAGEVYALG